MRKPNYSVVEATTERVIIRDIGPWDQHPTVTNEAEVVVKELAEWLGNRRLFYFDSEGALDELLVKEGKFVGFKPGPIRKVVGG